MLYRQHQNTFCGENEELFNVDVTGVKLLLKGPKIIEKASFLVSYELTVNAVIS
jgi:hypothetical protein